MTTNRSPIDDLTAHLARRSRTKEGRSAMTRFRHAGIDVGNALSPYELALTCHHPGQRAHAEAVVAGLLALADSDEVAALVVLVALRPALRRLTGRLALRGHDVDGALTDVVTTAWEVITSLAHPRPMTARRVVAATWNRCRTESRRARHQQAAEDSFPDDLDREDPGSDPADRVSTLLDDALRHGVLTPGQAALVQETRVVGRPAVEIARATGRSPAAVWKERDRAEAALRRFVGMPNGRTAVEVVP